jgi:iron(III) transport system substrate-binding protein
MLNLVQHLVLSVPRPWNGLFGEILKRVQDDMFKEFQILFVTILQGGRPMRKCSVSKSAVVVLCLLAVFAFWVGIPWAAEAPILKTLEGKEKERVAGLIEAARKEGKFVWATNAINVDTCKALEKTFKELYGLPNLDVNLTYESSSVIQRRIDTEVRADKVSQDVVMQATPIWFHSLLRRGGLMQYTSPEDKAYIYSAQLKMMVPGYWVAERLQIQTIAWNPKAVPGVKITGWTDLFDPRLKGKIVVGDAGRAETMALAYMAHRTVLPKKFFEDLNKMGVTLIFRTERARQSVVAGEFALSTYMTARHVFTASKEGVQLDICYPKEGIAALPLASVILAKAPHPNAAKLFIDFFRSVKAIHITSEHNPYTYTRPVPPLPDAKLNEFVTRIAPPADKIKIIPQDFSKITGEDVKKWQEEFVDVFGLGKDKD